MLRGNLQVKAVFMFTCVSRSEGGSCQLLRMRPPQLLPSMYWARLGDYPVYLHVAAQQHFVSPSRFLSTSVPLSRGQLTSLVPQPSAPCFSSHAQNHLPIAIPHQTVPYGSLPLLAPHLCVVVRRFSRLTENRSPRSRRTLRIQVKTLHLIDEAGHSLGVMTRETAEGLAAAKGLELSLVQKERGDANAMYRMVSKKQLWDEKKKQKEMKRKDPRSITKEMSFTTNIAEHDLAVKLGHVREFLEKKHSVKLSIVEMRAWGEKERAHEKVRQKELMARVVKEVASVGMKAKENAVGRKLVCLFRAIV